jgi:hypothetical protein
MSKLNRMTVWVVRTPRYPQAAVEIARTDMEGMILE